MRLAILRDFATSLTADNLFCDRGAECWRCCRCHVELDLAVARCPGEAVLGADRLHTCAVGYTGTTCNSCMDGFGMSSDRVCEACEDSGYTVESFLMLAGVIVGLMLAIFILGRIWKGLQLKHVLRCAFQVNPPGWSILVPLQNISASRLRRL